MTMFRKLAAVLACLGMLTPPVVAAPCRVQVQHAQAAFVHVPYLVAAPVAVVAQGSPVYSVNQHAVSGDLSAVIAELQAIRQTLEAQRPQAMVQQTMISLHCANCHDPNGSKPNQKAIEAIDLSKPLTALDYNDMMTAVREGTMPKGKQFDPVTAGKFFKETLAFQSEALRAEVGPRGDAPPAPMPPK